MGGSEKEFTFLSIIPQRHTQINGPGNYLKGVIGDIMNPIISAIGLNLRCLGNHTRQVKGKLTNYQLKNCIRSDPWLKV